MNCPMRNTGVETINSSQMISRAEKVKPIRINPNLRIQTINDDWKFIRGDQSGAYRIVCDESRWESVDLPHDYSIEQEFTPSGEAESGYLLGGIGWYRKTIFLPKEIAGKRVAINFDGVYMDATVYVNGIELANHPYGYTPFTIDASDAVQFGTVNVIAVRVNHQIPSSRWYSGSGIYRNVDLIITESICVATNGVSVQATNIDQYVAAMQQVKVVSQADRETTLVTSKTTSGTAEFKNEFVNGASSDMPHLALEISTQLWNTTEKPAAVVITHTLVSQSDGEVIGAVSDQQKLAAKESIIVTTGLAVSQIKLWNPDDPQLYIVKTVISENDKIIDAVDTITGFRSLTFDPNTGFAINGKKLKLKGVCMHHDQGALGAKAYRDAITRQLDILQDMGANTIRITHNPASRELIELANERGLLLIEEIFDGLDYPKNENFNDYARFFNQFVPAGTKLEHVSVGSTWARFDLETTLRRDRNAPSVIMWSLGNEIGEGTGTHTIVSDYTRTQDNLIRWMQALDDYRPVTRGDNQVKQTGLAKQASETLLNSLVQAGGTAGVNYASGDLYDQLHECYPHWMLYGSETASAVNSRGCYRRFMQVDNEKTVDKCLTSYDHSKVPWGATASSAWYEVITRDFVAGEMVWTGFDYIGEPTPWNGITSGPVSHLGDPSPWPAPKNSYFGIVDTAGFPKDSYYFYQSQWNETCTTLHLLPAWNETVVAKNPDGTVPVVVYSNAPTVRLYFTPKNEAKTERKLIGEKSFTQVRTPAGHTYQIYQGIDASKIPAENLYLTWNVPYQDGTLEAIAYDNDGNEITATAGRSSVSTTGKAAKLAVTVDREELRANNQDLAYFAVEIIDAEGNLIPDAEQNVHFALTKTTCVDNESMLQEGCSTKSGENFLGSVESAELAAAIPCTIIGTDNGEQVDHTSYLSHTRKTFAGKALGIIKSSDFPGECAVTVSAAGLIPQTVLLNVNALDNDFTQQGNLQQISAQHNCIDAIAAEVERVQRVHYYIYPRNFYLRIGETPRLPKQIKTVLQNGKQISLPVDWESVSQSKYLQAGNFVVHGKVDLTASAEISAASSGSASKCAGAADKHDVSANDLIFANIIVVPQVACVLNYSDVTPIGQVPLLPLSRPGVDADGNILDIDFPVAWQVLDAAVFNHEGMIELAGSACVFDRQIPVSATIRVARAETGIGGNAAPAAKLSQSISSQLQTGSLNSLVDRETKLELLKANLANATETANIDLSEHLWANCRAVKSGQENAEIFFEYATEQGFAEFQIFFYRGAGSNANGIFAINNHRNQPENKMRKSEVSRKLDSGKLDSGQSGFAVVNKDDCADFQDASNPDPESTKFYIGNSISGPWEEVPVVEIIGTEEKCTVQMRGQDEQSLGYITQYTYQLAAPVTGTCLKLSLHNPKSAHDCAGNTAKYNQGTKSTAIETVAGLAHNSTANSFIAISEVVLLASVSQGVSVNNTAEVEVLPAKTADQLPAEITQVHRISANRIACSKDNAAMTIVPTQSDTTGECIIVESEDHLQRKTIQI